MQALHGYTQTPRPWHRILVAVALGVTVLAGMAYATDSPPPELPAEPERREATGESARADPTAPASPPTGRADVFVPSEEISEDFTVSFPVDI
jgi:hypothetical protein